MTEPIRLQRFLSQAGVASRRRAEELIRAGRVRVDGVVVTELGGRVDPETARVEVDGRRVRPVARRWIALHKPVGYVTTRKDPEGRPTIYDLLPSEFHGLFYVGRLDYNSEGLVLLTNDGDGAHRLTHPRYGVERVYEVDVEGQVPAAALRRLETGVMLEDGPARAERAIRRPGAEPGTSRLHVTLREGRKREVRRMLQAIGHPVRRLVRIQYGAVKLGALAPGAWRHLTSNETLALSAVGRDGA
ncbi:MAG: rRNA pseudouridine synthase [Gemmatimonadetes bacterium]|nr:rRNA pseudouridine synthase [Gemmatimonadota bacterium]